MSTAGQSDRLICNSSSSVCFGERETIHHARANMPNTNNARKKMNNTFNIFDNSDGNAAVC